MCSRPGWVTYELKPGPPPFWECIDEYGNEWTEVFVSEDVPSV